MVLKRIKNNPAGKHMSSYRANDTVMTPTGLSQKSNSS